MVLLFWALGSLSCLQEDASKGSYIYVPDAKTVARGLHADVPILFLNRCEGGCEFKPGADDSRTNHSSIIRWDVTLREFAHSPSDWHKMLRCVQEMYEPFEIRVTDVDPGDHPHIESVVAGHPSNIGISGAGGVSPFACGVIENGINFTFADVIQTWEQLCVVVAQESGHTFGLDHQMLCNDPMTYLPSCGEHKFRRVDAFCGEQEERECFCGGTIQNSQIALLDALGPRTTLVDFSPTVEIIVPYEREVVEPNFRVFAEIKDDQIEAAELYIDNVLTQTTTIAPFGFSTPTDLAPGDHTLTVRAWDPVGQEASDTIVVEMGSARLIRDAGVFDAGEDPGPPPRMEPTAPPEPGPLAGRRTVDTEGCRCATSVARGTNAPWLGGLILLVMLPLFWRRKQ